MIGIQTINPLARAILVVAAVAGLVTAVTFATVNSTATLTNNSVSTATADLEVSTDADCATTGTGFSSSVTGFDFTGIVPGGAASADFEFCLRNAGDANLSTLLTIPALPTYTDSSAAPVAVDNSKVDVNLTCVTVSTDPFGAGGTLQEIWFSGVDQGELAAGDIATCTANVSMAADAFTADSASSTDFNLVFTGNGV